MVLLVGASAAAAKEPQTVTLAWVPAGTTVQQLADAGFSPGLMSAGLGKVSAEQTYLDIGQGNRVFNSLYDEPLPEFDGDRQGWWKAVVKRAESAPAEIVPGLLTSALVKAGVRSFDVRSSALSGLAPAAEDLSDDDLLIAIARPSGESDAPLAIGIAGRDFDGNLTSDSTRTDGYVLSTDVAPTILDRFGAEIPAEMSGQPIRSEGSVDVAAIESLGGRMGVISHRRGPVIGLSLLAWIVALGLTVALSKGALARPAVRTVGLSVIYMPLVMLLGAAIEPGESAEVLLVMLGAPLLAALTLVLLRGYRALAAAAALTVAAYAIDLIAGSPLTSLSLLGPNPGLGVRFYGIGNELEALLAVLVVAGTGAGIAGFLPGLDRRRAAAVFVVLGLLAAFVFAAGRFGADVGAAIVFPIGAVVAAVAIAGRGRRVGLLVVIAAPFAMLALLVLIDLVSGANAHLTRSVLDAGGLGDLSDVAQRRLQLSAHSFARPVLLIFLPVVAILALLAFLRRDRLRAWVREVPAVRAGLLGALAATVVGTLANDSGALILEIGTAYLLVFAGFAWAESRGR
ncbi:MAG: hypothetical protein JJE35_01835 [Thermoleophilia bacterium]|nr:hypothetical protein [Thermoleophilia bacterium]